MKLKLFILDRQIDESGVSGTGVVAYGIIFPNGWCALSWASEHSCVGVYPNIETLLHVHGHTGKTYCLQVMEYDHELAGRLITNRLQDNFEGVRGENQPNGKYFSDEVERYASMFKTIHIPDPKSNS